MHSHSAEVSVGAMLNSLLLLDPHLGAAGGDAEQCLVPPALKLMVCDLGQAFWHLLGLTSRKGKLQLLSFLPFTSLGV